LTRSKIKSIYISILTKDQLSKELILPYLTLGLLSVIYGISVYYFLPLALISLNLGLLLQVFFIILIGLFLGLVLIAVNLQSYTEYILTNILFKVLYFIETRSMERVVQNNMRAHRLRNRQTSFIYAAAVGFIIFLLGQY
jgi:hypothetical protein